MECSRSSNLTDLLAVKLDPVFESLNAHPIGIIVRTIIEIGGNFAAAADARRISAPLVNRRQNLVVTRIFICMRCVLDTDHLLVELLPRPNTDNLVPGSRNRGLGDLRDIHRWNFLDIDLAADHVLEGAPNQFNRLLESDHETRHAHISNRHDSFPRQGQEKGNHRTARAHYISVTHDSKTSLVAARVGVTGNEELVRGEFAGAV